MSVNFEAHVDNIGHSARNQTLISFTILVKKRKFQKIL